MVSFFYFSLLGFEFKILIVPIQSSAKSECHHLLWHRYLGKEDERYMEQFVSL